MVQLEPVAVPLQTSDATGTVFGIAVLLFQLLLAGIQFAGMWAVFSKAGRAGWKAIIPIYNIYVMTQIGDLEWWWLLLLIVPVVNIYAVYKIHLGIAQSFGRGIGFGLGLAFFGLVFFPLLGFGDYQYRDSAQLG
jgi:hypothetical protein